MDKLYSFHSFMFPFRWDYIKSNVKKENISYSERTNLDDFDKLFSENGLLEKTPYTIDKDNRKYNEYTYFHSFVRKALFYTEDAKNSELLHYSKEGNLTDYFKITCKGKEEPYKLQLKSIGLHVYSTGVGILTFNLYNNAYPEKEHILRINEFGRRIYPQFLKDNSLEATQDSFLAEKIEIKIGDTLLKEDFRSYLSPLAPGQTFIPPTYIKQVFDLNDTGLFVYNKNDEAKGKIRIRKLTDDRMFFLSWYGNDDCKSITQPKKQVGHYRKIPRLVAKKNYSDWWYSYVFGDKAGPTISDTDLMNEALSNSTYTRWKGYGTLYGMTRDSFVAISEVNVVPMLSEHFQTMYYHIVVLCLVQRASILRFSYETSTISNELEKDNYSQERIKDLYKNYIHFINKIYFREVTSQIQGIELYNQLQKVMNLEKEMTDLDKEVSELYNYSNMTEQAKLSRMANWFLPASVIVGFLGMNMFEADGLKLFKENSSDSFNWNLVCWLFIVLGLSYSVIRLPKIYSYLKQLIKK